MWIANLRFMFAGVLLAGTTNYPSGVSQPAKTIQVPNFQVESIE
jgi:hypothetical protein